MTLRALCVIALGLILLSASNVFALDLRELIREIEDQHTGRSSRTVMNMQVKTTHWERNLEMNAVSLGRDHFLVRIQEPAKEKGVATLKVGQEVWNYLPKVDRVIKVPPSMMGGSWMGSHITNNDLVKAAKIDQDYNFDLLEETDETWRINCIPKAEAAVVWGRIVYLVEKARRVPLTVDYFDEDDVKVRTITFDKVKEIDGRQVPMRMAVQPLEKPQESTVMHYRELEFGVPVDKSFFSLRNLRQR